MKNDIDPPSTNNPDAKQQDSIVSVLFQLQASLNQMDYFQAVECAAGGDLSKAESILRSLVKKEPTPANLDMLARILAQQKRFDEASAIWEQILSDCPDHPNARAALEVIRKRRKGNTISSNVFPIIIISLFLALGLILLLQVSNLRQTISQTALNANRPQIIPELKITMPVVDPPSVDQIASRIKPELNSIEKNTIQEVVAEREDLHGLATQVAGLQISLEKTPAPQNSLFIPTFN